MTANQPYQQRVIEEKRDLDSRIDRLCAFCQGDVFQALPSYEKLLLEAQLHAMTGYSAILGSRIAGFR